MILGLLLCWQRRGRLFRNLFHCGCRSGGWSSWLCLLQPVKTVEAIPRTAKARTINTFFILISSVT